MLEHPLDVLNMVIREIEQGRKSALAIVVKTEGGAVRAPGALMGVSETGASTGYVSGGCVDEDVKQNALAVIKDQTPKQLRYGKGSLFIDLPLPCGGAIEILILPISDIGDLKKITNELDARKKVHVCVGREGLFRATRAKSTPTRGSILETQYIPKMKLRIAGKNADAIALAKLAVASGMPVCFQSPDERDIDHARSIGVTDVEHLASAQQLSSVKDDPYTAFVLMFHDADWESPLLIQALSTPAFYIGAVGSPRTHQMRCEALRAAGCSQMDIARIRGPVGLVKSLRGATTLAISTLAEIVGDFKNVHQSSE